MEPDSFNTKKVLLNYILELGKFLSFFEAIN